MEAWIDELLSDLQKTCKKFVYKQSEGQAAKKPIWIGNELSNKEKKN